MHGLLQRIRLDGGKINKEKIAGTYQAPAGSGPSMPAAKAQTGPAGGGGGDDIRAKLQSLKELEASGLITKDEAAAKRREILKGL